MDNMAFLLKHTQPLALAGKVVYLLLQGFEGFSPKASLVSHVYVLVTYQRRYNQTVY